MKLNRLLEITTILLNRKTVTAAELAERFGVSLRTIYRDIEVLSTSGVPVYSSQGRNGGISILDDFTVSRTLLSESERDGILLALQTLRSIKYPEADIILEKLSSLFKKTMSDWISVDLTPWGADPDADSRFHTIKEAIIKNRSIEIDYINSSNIKSHRRIVPLRLMYKSRAWYLYGFCLSRHENRTFRISRIKNVIISDEEFDSNKIRITDNEVSVNEGEKPLVHLVLEFTEEALYRLYDDYDDERLRYNEDGTYTLEAEFPEDEWVYSYILSFGSFVKVIAPERVRRIIRAKSEEILSFYK